MFFLIVEFVYLSGYEPEKRQLTLEKWDNTFEAWKLKPAFLVSASFSACLGGKSALGQHISWVAGTRGKSVVFMILLESFLGACGCSHLPKMLDRMVFWSHAAAMICFSRGRETHSSLYSHYCWLLHNSVQFSVRKHMKLQQLLINLISFAQQEIYYPAGHFISTWQCIVPVQLTKPQHTLSCRTGASCTLCVEKLPWGCDSAPPV